MTNIADKLAQALRANDFRGPMADEALATYDSAVVAASGVTHSEEFWRWHSECAQWRVEELERELAAWKQAVAEAIAESPTRLRASPMPWASCAEWINNRVAELMEKEHG